MSRIKIISIARNGKSTLSSGCVSARHLASPQADSCSVANQHCEQANNK